MPEAPTRHRGGGDSILTLDGDESFRFADRIGLPAIRSALVLPIVYIRWSRGPKTETSRGHWGERRRFLVAHGNLGRRIANMA
jgi:hypothetical protein